MERNDSLVVAEAAHQGYTIFLSSDRHCLEVHDDEAGFLDGSQGMPGVENPQTDRRQAGSHREEIRVTR